MAFPGKIFPVGPKGGRVFDLHIFPSLLDLPQPPELVAVLAPARVVPDILDDCGRLGVKQVVVESGGFSELGREGRQLEDQVRQRLKRHGIRMMGPNGLGIINLEIGLCLPFMTFPTMPRLGRRLPHLPERRGRQQCHRLAGPIRSGHEQVRQCGLVWPSNAGTRHGYGHERVFQE